MIDTLKENVEIVGKVLEAVAEDSDVLVKIGAIGSLYDLDDSIAGAAYGRQVAIALVEGSMDRGAQFVPGFFLGLAFAAEAFPEASTESLEEFKATLARVENKDE